MKKLLIFIALLNFSNCFSQSVDTVSNLSNQEKILGLSKFWSEAKYNFAFFDKTKINWDSTYNVFIPKVLATKNTWEYYRVLQQFCALLKDGHTNVFVSPKLFKGSRYKEISFENFNKKAIVARVREEAKDIDRKSVV